MSTTVDTYFLEYCNSTYELLVSPGVHVQKIYLAKLIAKKVNTQWVWVKHHLPEKKLTPLSKDEIQSLTFNLLRATQTFKETN